MIGKLFPGLRLGFEKLFDKFSLAHTFLSAVLAFVFGFFPALAFGAYYEVSQSYMPRALLGKPSKLERLIFTSNGFSDLYDLLVYDLVGCFLGSFLRTLIGLSFY